MAAISSLGVGSGLDLGTLVSGLVEAERAPVANRLASKESNLNAELSAFGLLRSSLAQFQSSIGGLQSGTDFNAKDLSLSSDYAFSATVEPFADVGSYAVEVSAIARAQSLASNGASAFATVDDVVGEGTLSIQFGTTSTGPYAFTPDTAQPPRVIDVSAANANNTLSGLRDYINDNDYDVQAAIVNDGSGYRLVLTSARSGALNSMEISVTGDSDANDTDNSGLSQLAFNAAAQGSMLQTVGAQDAALSVNGLDITRDSNSVTGAINGVTLDLLNADPGNIVKVDVSESHSQISASINGFVEAYNELVNNIDSLTAYNPESGEGSILIGDFTVRSIGSQMRSILFGSVSGLDGNVRSLVDIGMTTNASGTLDVDGAKLADALKNDGPEVEALFALQGRASDAGVRFAASTAESRTGDYAVGVTSVLTQGILVGSGPVTDLRVRNNSNNMTLLVDGISTGNITLTNGNYANEAALAAEIETRINAAPDLLTNGISVTVGYNAPADRFEITSNSSGSGSTVAITAADPQVFNRYGLAVASGIAGTDFSGTIDGVAATPSGNTLTSVAGDSIGIAVEVVAGGVGSRGTVSLTRGLAGAMDALLDGLLQAGGTIASRESSINDGLGDIEDERIRLDDRIASLEARLVRQFSALDTLVAQFNQTSSFLSQQLASLPQPNSTGGSR